MANAWLNGLLAFLKASPTPFHAVQNMAVQLNAAGFTELREAQDWDLQPGQKYFVTRNDAALIAFVHGTHALAENGVRMVGAHTDSPCLKIKPQPETIAHGYFQLGVEVYGGALLHPWFDRDLSLAGRITCVNNRGAIGSLLVDFEKPLAVIPSLAIHLDREANKQRAVNAQNHLPPVVMRAEGKTDFRELLLEQVREVAGDIGKVLDYELCLYDVQPPALVGLNREFIAGARLDNLLSCYTGLQALLHHGDALQQSVVLVCNDHEEVGSVSSSGADGNFLRSVLERWMPDAQERARALDASMLVSTDNAHALHPNYSDKHDAHHAPVMNGGPVIKVNAGQRYASNSETQALFRYWCEQENVPVQCFAVRSDMGCGSTIGPLTAAALGVKTVDVGVPQLAMHSIRELCGARDPEYLCRVLQRFYRGN